MVHQSCPRSVLSITWEADMLLQDILTLPPEDGPPAIDVLGEDLIGSLAQLEDHFRLII